MLEKDAVTPMEVEESGTKILTKKVSFLKSSAAACFCNIPTMGKATLMFFFIYFEKR